MVALGWLDLFDPSIIIPCVYRRQCLPTRVFIWPMNNRIARVEMWPLDEEANGLARSL
jgi:hypothetical protein